ncbi:MAG: MMPL family transporter [Solirubrobacteraceae bacterium]
MTRLADLATRAPKRTVILAAIFFAVAGVLGGSVAERLDPYGAEDPATESVQANQRFEAAAGREASPGVIALVDAGGPVRSTRARAKVATVAAKLRRDPAVAQVVDYYGSRDPAMVSRDGRSTYVLAFFRPASDKAVETAAERLNEDFKGTDGVVLGGSGIASTQVGETVGADLARAELLAFPLLFILSLLFFRSLVAALLPLMVGAMAILSTFLALRLGSELGSISIFALNLTTGLGLGLAIDYSLFIVSRYREEIAKTGPGREAMRRTLQTAGRTVLFSSLTVAAALASLLVFPQRFLYSMGLGGAIVALIAAAIALLVLPAVLALLGARVNSLTPRFLRRAAERDARPAPDGAWYRLARAVLRRPGRVAAASAALLIAMGIPFLGIKFTSADASILPADTSGRQVHDALKRDFPANRDTPIFVAVDTSRAASPAAVRAQSTRLAADLGALPGAADVSAPRAAGRGTAVITVISKNAVFSDATQDLVRDARGVDTPLDAKVGGAAAEFVDTKSSLAGHLPYAVAIVAVSTLLILFLMTGSVVLPLKALVMNLLTLSAAYGLLVLIFQDGRLEGILDFTSQGAIESTMPVLLFAVVFGLSTDYGVFLLSRIKEARDGGSPDDEAVAIGLERTGRIVTAAALLFCIAIGAFATSQIIFIKENGVGTAVAVIIDATIVRALLVPALMGLLGRWNWWAPAPLRRLHARIGISESAPAPEPATGARA